VDAPLVEPGAGTHHAARWAPFDNARHHFGVASESQTGCPSPCRTRYRGGLL